LTGVDRLPALTGCPVCGQALPDGAACPNYWCGRTDRAFSVVFAVSVHRGALRQAVLRYKYQRELWWAEVFARLFADYLRRHATWFEEFDLLVPTPSYLGPRARRSWDPVGQIVVRLGAYLEPAWDSAPGAVVKRAETPPMQGRTSGVRRMIAAGALRRALSVPSPRLVAGARILVVDDVLTDGSTLREMALVLRQAGALEVAGLVLTRPPWRGLPLIRAARSEGPDGKEDRHPDP
jgi:predicted amidophosphoribosyltransferase